MLTFCTAFALEDTLYSCKLCIFCFSPCVLSSFVADIVFLLLLLCSAGRFHLFFLSPPVGFSAFYFLPSLLPFPLSPILILSPSLLILFLCSFSSSFSFFFIFPLSFDLLSFSPRQEFTSVVFCCCCSCPSNP